MKRPPFFRFVLSLFSLWLCGCAAGMRKPISARVELARHCITKVELSEKTQCKGPDLEHLSCTGIVLTKKNGCETLHVESAQPANHSR